MARKNMLNFEQLMKLFFFWVVMKLNTVEPIRDKRDVYAMKKYLRQKDEKYYIMFITGIYLGLRINEILKMTVGDVKGRTSGKIRQSKTGKERTIAYNDELIRAYRSYCEHRAPDEALIPNPTNEYKPISRDMAYKVLREAAEHIGIKYAVGTHTLRKTCGYHYYRQTHDIVTLQMWFNHRSAADTLRYIGINEDSVLKAMKSFKI